MPAPEDQPRWPESIPWSPRGPAPGRWRSRADATSWTDLLYRRIVGTPSWADQSRVGRLAMQRPMGERPLAGGGMAQTSELIYPSGEVAVRKTFHGLGGARKASAEYLAALVAQAVGAPAPAVVKDPTDPDFSVIMGRVEGDSGMVHTGSADATAAGGLAAYAQALYYLADTDAGRRIGLLDVLISNHDRHAMNWILSSELDEPFPWPHRPDQNPLRRPIAIDHSETFLYTEYQVQGQDGQFYMMPFLDQSYPGFTTPWLRWDTKYYDEAGDEILEPALTYKANPLYPEDVPVLRARLEGLRQEFESQDMLSAYFAMMRRFEAVAAHADGPGGDIDGRGRMFP